MKHVMKLGKALSKAEQKSINGGSGSGCQTGYVYAECDPNPNNPPYPDPNNPPNPDPCIICVN